MSTLYLIRHGQAGSRENYDQLSDLGSMQATLLGRYFDERGITFHAAFAGGMKRQQQTATAVLSNQKAEATLVTDPRWNEFILSDVYRWLVPRLTAESPQFASDHEEMQRALLSDPHTTRGAAGRCDRAVIEAWMENRYPDEEMESWESFRSRVESSFPDLVANRSESTIGIFTSATPIAIWVGRALSLSNDRILRLMAVLLNSSVTTIKLREGEPLLLNFNMTPHLHDPQLVTFR